MKKIEVREQIELGDKILRPLKSLSYINKAYTFASEDEIKQYVERARNESLDTLYRKVKAIWKKYIDADDFHISICAADTIFTYFQDRAGMTHYLIFCRRSRFRKVKQSRSIPFSSLQKHDKYWDNSS